MPGLYGNVGNTTVSGGNTTSLYSTGTPVTVSNNLNVNDINASGNLFVAGTGTFGGNVTAPNFFGNVYGNIVGNLVVPGSNTNVLFNNDGNAGASSNFSFNQGTNLLTLNGTANVTALNATGNISGNYIFGNGSQLTGLPATYGNANVEAYLASGTNTGNIITSGNVSGNYFLGNGALLTGIASSYGNANVAAFLPTYTGNLGGGNLNLTGTAYGSGAGLSNLPGANVTGTVANAAYATNAGAATTATSATTAVTVTGNAQANITSVGTLTSLAVTGNVTTGNVSGTNGTFTTVIGDGAQLSNITGANVTGTVANATYATSAGSATTATHALTANTVTDAAQGNITSVGTLTGLTVGGDQNITGNLIVGQNLTVNGNTIQVNITELNVQDPIIGLGRGENNAPLTSNDGKDRGEQLWYYAGSEKSAFTGYDNSAGNLLLATDVTIANEIVSVNAYGTTEVGTLYAHGNVLSGNVNATGNISGGNVIGTFLYGDGTNITGVVAGAASTRIEVKNTSGVTITKGTPVYATGTVGASTIIEIAASRADTASTMPCLGLLAQDLANNGQGYAISVGTLTSTNTNGFTTGQELYVAAAGGLTASRPTGTNIVQTVGIVGRVNSVNGSIEVNVWNVNSLPNLGNGNVWVGNANGFPTQQVAYGDANVAAYLPTYTGNLSAGNISITGVYYGDGSGLTNINAGNIVGGYGNANVSNFLANGFGSNTIVTTGNITGGNIVTSGSGLLIGNLFTTVASDSTANVILAGMGLNDSFRIQVGGNADFGYAEFATADNGNEPIYVRQYNNYFVTPARTLTLLDESGNTSIPGNLNVTGNIQGSYIIGDGSALSSITGANVTGTVANATYATSAGSATTAGTVTGNAQANITSVGTLTTLSVSGNIDTGGILTDNYYYANGTPISFGGTYGNANVADYLPTYTGNIRAVTGSIGVANTVANLAIGPSAANLVVQGNLHVAAGNIRSTATDGVIFGAMTGTGNLYTVAATVNIGGTGSTTNIRGAAAVTGNVSGSNLNTTGQVVATGTVKAGAVTYANTDGSNGQVLTTYGNGITYWSSTGTSAYGNANVEAFLASGTNASNIVTTGNLIASDGLFVTDGNAVLSKELFVAGNIFANASNIQCQSLILDGGGDIIGTAGANINLSGTARFTGNVTSTGGIFIGDGSGLTNVAGSYGNANVSNFLANGFGSNTITTTGNITVGNLNATQSVVVSGAAGNITGANYVNANFFVGNGSQLTGITSTLAGNLSGNITANGYFINGLTAITITGNANVGNLGTTAVVATGNVTGGNVIATGTVQSGAVTYANVDGTNGQVLTTYGNGVTYFSTVSGGGGTPGGANTQIQFNDGGSFAGNSLMTFNKTTGNIEQGNLRIITNNAGQNPILINTQSFVSTTRPNPGRIGIGLAYGADWTTTYDTANRWRNARLAVVDRVLGSGAGNTTFSSAVNYFETASELYAVNDSGSRVTDSTAFGAGRFGLQLWGPSAFGNTSNATHLVASYSALGAAVNIGNTTVGNANVVSAVASTNTIQVNAGSNCNLAISTTASSTNLGTMGTWIGQGFNVTFGSTLTAPGNVWLIHNPGSQNNNLSSASYSIQDSYRAATTYYFLRNDDNAAQVRLGSLRAYHQFRNGLTASAGNITANAAGATGTVFYHNPAANANLLVTGAVVTASDSVNTDQQVTTLTIIIDQGATGYDITLPTTSGTNLFRYAAGANTVGNTANSTSIITYKVYQDAGGNTVYNGRVENYT